LHLPACALLFHLLAPHTHWGRSQPAGQKLTADILSMAISS